MSRVISELLSRQHAIAWRLASYHLDKLSTGECLWRPSSKGLHVAVGAEGWRGEWPQHEGYDLGPPSIAWLLWHIGYWWSMAINHSFEDASLARDVIICPGESGEARAWLGSLHNRWTELFAALDDEELLSATRTRFPFKDRPFADVAAWVNMELTKNASELGYARFLYAVRPGA